MNAKEIINKWPGPFALAAVGFVLATMFVGVRG